MNEYAYAGGDPVNATDPSGLSWECFAGRYYAEAAAFRTPGGVWSLASVTACGGGGGSTTRRWEDRYLENGPAGWNPYAYYNHPYRSGGSFPTMGPAPYRPTPVRADPRATPRGFTNRLTVNSRCMVGVLNAAMAVRDGCTT